MTKVQGGAIVPIADSDGTVQGGSAVPVVLVDADSDTVQGGSAIPIAIVTGRPVQGGTPIRVARVTGRVVQGGSALPVYVIADETTSTETILDSFSDTKAAGAVVGSTSPSGATRGGADAESLIFTNSGRALLPALTTKGWQREGLVYGPYTRQNGHCFIVKLQAGDVQAFDGSVKTSLALGWFGSNSPSNPVTDGNALIIQSDGTNAGSLDRNGQDSTSPGRLVDNPLVSQLKQVPLYLIIALWSNGARYYVAGLPNQRELPSVGYPTMRLLHVAALNRTTTPLYASIWQRMMLNGPTNIWGIDVVDYAGWANWYGSAHFADSFIGSGTVPSGGTRAADTGGSWTIASGTTGASLTANGIQPNGSQYVLMGATPPAPSGIISFILDTGTAVTDSYGIELQFRKSGLFGWFVVFGNTGATLSKLVDGSATTMATYPVTTAHTNQTYVVTVRDDGTRMQVWIDNTLIFNFADATYGTQAGVNLYIPKNTTYTLRYFETHPRSLTMPTVLQTLGSPASEWPAQGATSVYTEDFSGSAGDLAGKTTTTGSGVWANSSGGSGGTIALTGSGKAAHTTGVADTIYSVPWSSSSFVDVSVDVTVPGTGYGNGSVGWAGPIVYQDANNWIAVRTFVNDTQVNASELEVIDCRSGTAAIVQRVTFGTEIAHGGTITLRLVSDGQRVIIFKGTEPVITWRRSQWYGEAVAALTVSRVGIFGSATDTGSQYDNFAARSV